MRSRVALVAAVAVAAGVVLSSGVVYVVVRHDLLSRVDGALERHAGLLEQRRAKHGLIEAIQAPRHVPAELPSAPVLAQVVTDRGRVVASEQAGLRLPVGPGVLRVAAGRARPYFADLTVTGTSVRMLVTGFGPHLALEVIRPVTDLDAELERLAAVLIVTSAAGVILALLLGAGVAGLALRPVRRLTEAAEAVASTRDLAQEIPVEGRGELARLAASINTMLEALDSSQRAQRQLVADASHELRTPLTSLRTNVEVLAEEHALDAESRQQLLADLAAQFDVLSALLADLVELARQDDPGAVLAPAQVVALDEVVGEALRRSQLHHPEVRFVSVATSATPVMVVGVAADLERAIVNLLDNAAKWSPEGGTVEVSVSAGAPDPGRDAHEAQGRSTTHDAVVIVRDQGPGIGPEDRPHVFDRFYRARSTSQVPGSGLGLAIVRRIVEAHGGSVQVEGESGEGTSMVVKLPCAGGEHASPA
ncbi:MAG: HAMP domain-containing sensor histidine kinase [Actinomycetota bacterium]|nr:HAMP domain-containing sensor histidine kinase [Actinomycetota bacterium]